MRLLVQVLVLPMSLVAALMIAFGSLASSQRLTASAQVNPFAAQPTQSMLIGVSSSMYAADWSSTSNGWPMAFGWSPHGSVLRNDGSDFGSANWDRGIWNNHWIFAPYVVPRAFHDYAVDAEVQ